MQDLLRVEVGRQQERAVVAGPRHRRERLSGWRRGPPRDVPAAGIDHLQAGVVEKHAKGRQRRRCALVVSRCRGRWVVSGAPWG